VEARAGLPDSRNGEARKRLTGTLSLTKLCGVPSWLSNPVDPVAAYQALHLMAAYSIRPEIASALAGIAFGGDS